MKRRLIKILLYILLSLVLLLSLTYLVLRTQPVQQYLIHKLSAYISNQFKTEVSVRGINTNFRYLILEEVSINDLHKKPLLKIDKLELRIGKFKYNEKILLLNKIILNDAYIALRKYRNEEGFNYQFLIDYFSSKDTTKTTSENNWKITCKALDIRKSHFIFTEENKPVVASVLDYNNIDISELDVKISGIDFTGNAIKANIKNVSFREKNGFILNKFAVEAQLNPKSFTANNLIIKTDKSTIALNIVLKYNNYNDFNDIFNSVNLYANLKPLTKVELNDIAYFVPAMRGMNDLVGISGEFKGRINDFKGKFLNIKYGNSTKLIANLSCKGLPDFEKTYVNFYVDKFVVSKRDIDSFNLPVNNKQQLTTSEENHLKLPDILTALGDLKIKGNFSGYFNEFVSNAEFITDIGNAKTELSFNKNKDNGLIEYSGKIKASNFNIGKLSSNKNFGRADFKININGSGLDSKNLLVNLTGVVDTFYFKKYKYNNISIDGDVSKKRFEGHLKINDANIYMDFAGIVDYSNQKNPVMDFVTVVRDANLNKLNLIKNDSIVKLTTLLKVNIEGDNIDSVQGEIQVHDTKYTVGKQIYNLNNLAFSLNKQGRNHKILKLNSDYIDADITGDFMFSQLDESFNNLINAYIPSFYKIKKKYEIKNIPEQNFEYSIKLKSTNALCKLFVPILKVADNSEINGKFNSVNNTFTIIANSSRLKYKNNVFSNWHLDAKAQKGVFTLNTGCIRLFLSDSIWLDNFKIVALAGNDSVGYKIKWNNSPGTDQMLQAKSNSVPYSVQNTPQNKAEISGNISFKSAPKIVLKFLKSEIVINDSIWKIAAGSNIILDSTSIAINNLSFKSKSENQKINIQGKISKNPAEDINVIFDNFNISNLDMITKPRDINIAGIVNGKLSLNDIYNSPGIVAGINIKNLVFNNDKLGELNINSTFDPKKNALYAKADINFTGNAGSYEPLKVSGYYYPDSKDNNFDFNIEVANLRLEWLQYYLESFASGLTGYASGNLKLTGKTASPELTGKIIVESTQMKIDYLNTTYSMSGEIDFNKNDLTFRDCKLFGNNSIDPKKSSATLSGKMYHKFFSDIHLDLKIKLDNLTCLHTTVKDNSLFYGNAFASGDIKITGPTDNIIVDMDAKTEKNTKLFIPLYTPEELSESEFVIFRKRKSDKTGNLSNPNPNPKSYVVNLSGFRLNFELTATPEAEVQLVFDPKIGDIIKARGTGNIKLEINSTGDFNMYGDYVVDGGDYLFTLKNLINKHFIIQKGGRISWNGNPYAGDVNMKATYTLRTSLDPLRPDMPPTNRKLPVNCDIYLTDQLLKPAVNFNINFPELPLDFSLESYKMYIEPEINKQVFSLLVLRSFTTPAQFKGYETSSSSFANSSTLGSSSSELLSDQLSNWLSQINKDLDVGVKYHPGDMMTSDQVEVALGTQLFNNRLLVNGNVSAGGERRQNTQNSSSIVGDVIMEYKLTPEGGIRLKAFNKSNVNDYLNSTSPYTQGIGVFYRKEFDLLKDIFKSRKRIKE